MGRCNCDTCGYHINGKCAQEANMTNEEYEDYFIFKINCPHYSTGVKDINTVICEFMSDTFGKPCKLAVPVPTRCNNDCADSAQACWIRTFLAIKEKNDGQNNT